MASRPDRIDAAVKAMNEENGICREASLSSNGAGSVRHCVNKNALLKAGIDVTDPGTVDQWWIPEEDVVVLDLNSEG